MSHIIGKFNEKYLGNSTSNRFLFSVEEKPRRGPEKLPLW
jgi:hypothetical protein